MNSIKRTSRIIGILFLVQMMAAIINFSIILDPILYGPEDILVEISSNSSNVIIAMFLGLLCGASVFAIATIVFPILKMYSERIALWYFGLRLGEFLSWLITGIFLLSLLSLSQEYTQAEMQNPLHLKAIGKTLLSSHGATMNLSLIVYCLASIMFYYLLFRTKLVPRFISVWGLIAVPLLFTEITFNIFGASLGGMLLMMPIGLNEILLGTWLIVRGFNLSSIPPNTDKTQLDP